MQRQIFICTKATEVTNWINQPPQSNSGGENTSKDRRDTTFPYYLENSW